MTITAQRRYDNTAAGPATSMITPLSTKTPAPTIVPTANAMAANILNPSLRFTLLLILYTVDFWDLKIFANFIPLKRCHSQDVKNDELIAIVTGVLIRYESFVKFHSEKEKEHSTTDDEIE